MIPVAMRPSRLIYTEDRIRIEDSQSDDGEVLYRCSDGVPLLWIFSFGGRNIWDPGDDIVARGGAVGKRNPYETPVDVAITRLEAAEAELPSAPYLWPFLSAMPLMRRKLLSRPKTGYVRLVAPWMAMMTERHIEQWRAATAYAENCVNFTSAGREAEALAALSQLTPFCPFVPSADGKDLKRVEDSAAATHEDLAVKMALLALGEPDERGIFEQAARKEVGPAMEAYRALPPRQGVPQKLPSASEKPTTESAGGIMAKLAGVFRKK